MSENIYKEAWDFAYNELRTEYENDGKGTDFQLWFNMSYVEDTIDTITVSVSSEFLRQQMLKRGNFEIIQNKIRQIIGQDQLTINCIVKAEEKPKSVSKEPVSTSSFEKESAVETESTYVKVDTKKETKTKKKHPDLREDFTFENFIPGENSNYAYKASLSVAQNPGKLYNPILLYGSSGLGKTHLMQSIGNFIYQNSEEKLKICYTSAEAFTNEYTASLVTKSTEKFNQKYRNLDVLLLDDIHFLQAKPGLQEALFYTFNALRDRNAQMVFTCDRPINDIKNMADRLVSRLANGLCIDLQPPAYETRHAILQKKIELMGKPVKPEVVDYIAKNVETNVRELESALNKVIGYADLCGKDVTLEIAQEQLRDIFTPVTAGSISIETIQKVLCNNYQITVTDIKSKKRDQKFAVPRQIAMYLSRELTEYSYEEIGSEFGGKDHSTVMHACTKIEDLIKTDPLLNTRIQTYVREIKDYKSK